MSKPVLKAHPEICPGCYDLHLYCRYENSAHDWEEFPHQIAGYETGAASRKAARRAGWLLHRDGTATCPKCVQALAAKKGVRS